MKRVVGFTFIIIASMFLLHSESLAQSVTLTPQPSPSLTRAERIAFNNLSKSDQEEIIKAGLTTVLDASNEGNMAEPILKPNPGIITSQTVE